MSSILTIRTTRDKLFAVLGSHELVKLIENLTQDVTNTLPAMTDAVDVKVEAIQQAPAPDVDGLTSLLATLATQFNSASPVDLSFFSAAILDLQQQPTFVAEQLQSLDADMASLRETVAVLQQQLNDINQRPEL